MLPRLQYDTHWQPHLTPPYIAQGQQVSSLLEQARKAGGCCTFSRSDKDKNKNNFVTNYRVPSNADLQAAEAAVTEGAIVLTMRYTYHADAQIADSEALLQRVFEFLAATGMFGTCVTNFAFERLPDGYSAIEVTRFSTTH